MKILRYWATLYSYFIARKSCLTWNAWATPSSRSTHSARSSTGLPWRAGGSLPTQTSERRALLMGSRSLGVGLVLEGGGRWSGFNYTADYKREKWQDAMALTLEIFGQPTVCLKVKRLSIFFYPNFLVKYLMRFFAASSRLDTINESCDSTDIFLLQCDCENIEIVWRHFRQIDR